MFPDLATPAGWLPVVFMGLMGVALLLYVVLDGYDLGVGILLKSANDDEKDLMVASIGPFWDANETWLVLGIGLLLVAFPRAHGVILSAMYLPVVCMLIGLMLRGVAFDFRAKVPVAEQGRFDVLLSDARGVMDMRDDNGPVTVELPMGLLRRALLEAGRRLASSGRLREAEHALLLEPAEARDPFADRPRLAQQVAERADERRAMLSVTPPNGLGPVEAMPPIDVLPGPLAEMVGAVQTALVHLAMAAGDTPAHADPLTGVGIGTTSHTGTARTAASADEAIEKLEPGDVLVVRATSPAFNAVLAIAGAVVTCDGGALSHAAVLARELGIPAVVGAPGALDIEDGATVTVDPVLGKVAVA